jgi:hypothetical protein
VGFCAKPQCRSKFACHFPAEHPRFIVINIDPDAWVQELLKGECSGPDKDLRLFTCYFSAEQSDDRQQTDVPKESLHSRALKWLHQRPPSSQLDQKPFIGLSLQPSLDQGLEAHHC